MTRNRAQHIRIEIAPKTIFLILGIAFGIMVLYSIRSVVMLSFIAFVLTSAAIGPVKKLVKQKVPKWLAISTVYMTVLLLFTLIVSVISVPFARETTRLVENFPMIASNISEFINELGYGMGLSTPVLESQVFESGYAQFREYLSENLQSIISAGTEGLFGVLNVSMQFFGGLFTVISVVTISIYLAYDHDSVLQSITKNIKKKKDRVLVRRYINDVESKLGGWLRGQLLVSLITGTLVWISLSILGVPYALPLAVFTSVMTNIPIFGATLSLIPPFVIALAGGNWVQIIGVPVAYIVIQQVENNIVAPRIMSNTVGIRPVMVILAILIGAELAGFTGVLLAVPIAALIQLTWEFQTEYRKNLRKIDTKASTE